MFTKDNYFKQVKDIDINSLPDWLQESHQFVVEATSNGKDWNGYDKSPVIKEAIDLHFKGMAKHLSRKTSKSKPKAKPKSLPDDEAKEPDLFCPDKDSLSPEFWQARALAMQYLEPYVLRGNPLTSIHKGWINGKDKDNVVFIDPADDIIVVRKIAGQDVEEVFSAVGLYKEIAGNIGKKKQEPAPSSISMVSRIPEELRFIKRFVNLNGKTQTKEQLLRFINSLQKAIVEKRIRKTSEWAEQIRYIQDRLVETYNKINSKTTITLSPETAEKFKQFAVSEKLLASVGYIKRYIGMHEKPGIKDKAKALLSQIDKAVEKGIITESDPYIVPLYDIKKNLRNFLSERNTKTLRIETATLNGLQGILSGLEGCSCGGNNNDLNGVETTSEVMSSMDFANMQFSTIGLQGKWRDFIGDPAPGFTAMISGRPKYGKSTLCVAFAGHLAREHGTVLFVANEEGLGITLNEKLKAAKHPRLMVTDTLPANLSPYQYIFMDSVTRLGLNPDDLRRLKAANQGKAFVYVFQVTKDGRFRGPNDFQHDVDVVIDIPERGKAVQMGRYNQGGEMDIFENL
ncbi:MAG TPA: hypothetical protein VM802_10140 [Chitinophaga sp.]|uniref:hypothetical protein n=1 Tax=Chitinophaga sp. TaxID=1869181 RepID=UPI002C41D22B|nr:hypothetical protein [Chitinophaga sp.]HVI45222.1 hypothetical protein [Chitinophaga sp.]